MSFADRFQKTQPTNVVVSHRDLQQVQQIDIKYITKENPHQPRIIDKELVEEAKKYIKLVNQYQDIDKNILEENFGELLKNKQFISLVELALSIQETGELIQPIVLLKQDINSYMVVAGHRRYYAHLVLDRAKINAIVKKDIQDEELNTIALTENIQRQDLNTIELALSFKNALDKNLYATQDELAKKVGLHKSKISKYLKSLELPEYVVSDIKKNNTIKDVEFLYMLNKLNNDKDKEDYYLKVCAGEQTAKEATKEIKKRIKNPKSKAGAKTKSIDSIQSKKAKLAELIVDVQNLVNELYPHLNEKEKTNTSLMIQSKIVNKLDGLQ